MTTQMCIPGASPPMPPCSDGEGLDQSWTFYRNWVYEETPQKLLMPFRAMIRWAIMKEEQDHYVCARESDGNRGFEFGRRTIFQTSIDPKGIVTFGGWRLYTWPADNPEWHRMVLYELQRHLFS